MTVGDRIKKKRLELGLTQEELAKKAGYKSRSSINKIECSRDLPLSKVKKVAELLDCSPSYLMGWEDKENVLMNEANTDVALTNIPNHLKEYALRLASLSKDNQELIMQMIDKLKDKKEE